MESLDRIEGACNTCNAGSTGGTGSLDITELRADCDLDALFPNRKFVFENAKSSIFIAENENGFWLIVDRRNVFAQEFQFEPDDAAASPVCPVTALKIPNDTNAADPRFFDSLIKASEAVHAPDSVDV